MGEYVLNVFLITLFSPQKAGQLFDRPDVLILNHYMHSYGLWNENSDLDRVPQYFAINTISYLNIATLLLPGLQKTNGSVVVMSSVTGVISPTKLATYSAQKHALHGFFGSLRQDLALQGHKGISVTLSVLGLIVTKNSRERAKDLPVGKSAVQWESVGECALAILKAAALRKRQIYFPWYISVIETVHFFFPNFVDSAI